MRKKKTTCLRAFFFSPFLQLSGCSIFDYYKLLSLSRDFEPKSRGIPRIQYFAVRIKLSRTLLLFALQPCWCSTCPLSPERKSPSASRPFSPWRCSWWPFAKLCRPRRRRRWSVSTSLIASDRIFNSYLENIFTHRRMFFKTSRSTKSFLFYSYI